MRETITILVVDDAAIIREGIGHILRQTGYHAVEASTGAEGLRMAREHRPDIILLDVVLPDMDGRDVCAEIKRDPNLQHSYVMLITGRMISPDDKVHGFEGGADDYVMKPLKPKELLARVEAIARMKRAERQLREREEQYRSLFENLQDVFYRADRDGTILFTSPSVIQLLGYASEEIQGLNIKETLLTRPEQWDEIVRLLEETGWPGEYELSLKRCDGSVVWVSATAQWYTDVGGHILGVEGMLRDITERKQAETELQKAHNELEQRVQARTAELQQAKNIAEKALQEAELANQAKNRFLANMSHELRTPLNAVLGYAQLLKTSDSLPEQQQQWIRIITSSGEHLLTLINDLLDFSRLDAGQLELQITELYLPQFCDQLVEMFRIAARQKGLHFESHIASDLPSRIYADAKRVRQILMNLLNNAVKFTAQGRVTFRVETGRRPVSTTIRFEIEDTGVGMTAQQVHALDVPFQSAAKQQYYSDGVGVGLAMTSRLLALMGSQLHVESAVNQGTRFWFDLEVAFMTEKKAHIANAVPPAESAVDPVITQFQQRIRAAGVRPGVLIVDDEEVNRALLVELLQSWGIEAFEAESGHECLEKIEQSPPDAILIDLRMPIMDGFEVARHIRQSGKETPIIAISVDETRESQQEALEAGCDGFLPRPFSVPQLIALLQCYVLSNPDDTGQRAQESQTAMPQENTGQHKKYLLSQEITQELLPLAERGNVKQFRAVLDGLESVETHDEPFLRTLRELADRFEIDEIIRLLKKWQQDV